jgi:hypothetical protein
MTLTEMRSHRPHLQKPLAGRLRARPLLHLRAEGAFTRQRERRRTGATANKNKSVQKVQERSWPTDIRR